MECELTQGPFSVAYGMYFYITCMTGILNVPHFFFQLALQVLISRANILYSVFNTRLGENLGTISFFFLIFQCVE